MKAEESVLNFDGTSSALLKRFNGGKGSRRWVKVHCASQFQRGLISYLAKQGLLRVFDSDHRVIRILYRSKSDRGDSCGSCGHFGDPTARLLPVDCPKLALYPRKMARRIPEQD